MPRRDEFKCPSCGSTKIGIYGKQRECHACGAKWAPTDVQDAKPLERPRRKADQHARPKAMQTNRPRPLEKR